MLFREEDDVMGGGAETRSKMSGRWCGDEGSSGASGSVG